MNIQGTEVPKLGLGTFTITGQNCVEAVKDALQIGYRHIDTARMYGNETEVGRALRESPFDREDIFLTTKLWHDELKHEQVIASTQDSLRQLQTDYVDLLLIHWPSPNGVPLEATLDAMMELKENGKAKHIGVSNFPPSLLQKALDHAPIFCNQVEYHPFLKQHRLLKMAKENDLMLTAYCPLAKGDVPGNQRLQEIGERHGKNAPQVVLRWLMQQPKVAAIPRSTKHDNRVKNFDIFDFELSDEEMAEIHQMNQNKRKINPAFAPDWEQ